MTCSYGPKAEEGELLKILVVDDHPLIREALRQVLRRSTKLELQEAAVRRTRWRQPARAAVPTSSCSTSRCPAGRIRGAAPAARELSRHTGRRALRCRSARRVMRAIDGGAMGFIPKTSSSQLLLNALRLVLSGGIYLPPRCCARSRRAGRSATGSRTPPELRDPRELGLTGAPGAGARAARPGQAQQAHLPRPEPRRRHGEDTRDRDTQDPGRDEPHPGRDRR